ncbi:Rho GTPase activating protein [Paecilomyces lecythidis]|uniref:Rho GTPase activating protein n=1 Tax=Paecilomyces lecythidis TaxID=3004212 RepID=A0ABR3Y692_9EURO
MSQVRRQDYDDDLQVSSPKLPYSPTSRKDHVTLHSPSSNRNFLSRDYLNQRQNGQVSNPVNVTVAALRRPSLSPLNTNPQSEPPAKAKSPETSPRSPGSLSSVAHHLRLESQSLRSPVSSHYPSFPTPPSRSPQQTLALRKPEYGGNMTEQTVPDQSQKRPHVASPVQSQTSPPTSPANSATGPGERTRTMPRTSSIDSAISSLSLPSHSQKSSSDTNAVSSADINNLIAAAGSAEALIVHLLKEKHHAASQNSQLWKLVDKQRALLLGLNKDLERAIKDKDRYRKKLKELQCQVPPLPPGVVSQASDVQASTRDAAPPVQEPGAEEPLNRHDQTTQSSPTLSIDKTSSPLTAGFPAPPQSDAGRSHTSFANNGSPLLDTTASTSAAAMSSSKRNDGGLQQETDFLAGSDVIQQRGTIASQTLPESSIQSDLPPPNRKPPPAPLNLGGGERTDLHQTQDLFDASDSEYDDVLEVDEIPAVQRGRRKTREDDDREREAAFIREQEARSRSNKNKSQASQRSLAVSDGISPMTQAPQANLPASPRRMLAQPPPFAGAGHLSPPESLASVLSPDNNRSTAASPELRRVASPPMSPGLPVSPRPSDRPIGSPLPRTPRDVSGVASPPMSPRNDYPPIASPTTRKPNGTQPLSPLTESPKQTVPTIDANIKIDSPRDVPDIKKGIYQGLISEEYPGLLLPPNALPSIEVKVASSRLRPSRNSYLALKPTEEEPVFTLSVFSRSSRSELWRVEKVILALPQLDHQIRQVSKFAGKLPDRSVFTGHSPAKVDARRAALNEYFESLLDTPMDETAALVICRFLTTDAIEPRDDETTLLKNNGKASPEILRGPDGKPRKEGYLTKRGKNFGGWKARYFVLHGPELKYFESPGGPHLGTIKIYNAQIGKQSQHTGPQNGQGEDDSDNQYRHAFLILEPKKKDSSALVRHVLCAESDEERDEWVEALLQYVESQSSGDEAASSTPKGHAGHSGHAHNKQPPNAGPKQQQKLFHSGSKKGNSKGTTSPENDLADSNNTVQGFSYDDAVPAEPPVYGLPYDKEVSRPSHNQLAPLNEHGDFGPARQQSPDQGSLNSNTPKLISAPTNGAIIQDAGAWGNKPALTTKEKKRSIWGFRTRSSSDLASQIQASYETQTSFGHGNNSNERKSPVRPVFGIPLVEAVEFCGPRGLDVGLPAVVYRCIEYLQAKGAESEEGIFRLSGSNLVVKALKERFNTEGDVDFLEGDHYYDVHAVASLFKQYLRELPTTVLTRELHLDFLRVLELDEKSKKIAAFNILVHRLPKANLSLLQALSQFLIRIINNSDVNKMTVRNVGIVFAPTLNIPAPVFSMFLTDYDQIFRDAPTISEKTVEITVNHSTDEMRSPRHHAFSDPAPGYDPRHNGGQPGYDHYSYNSQPHDAGQQWNQMLAPNVGNPATSKAKRRESSMLFMDIGHRKHATTDLRGDPVAEESAFE